VLRYYGPVAGRFWLCFLLVLALSGCKNDVRGVSSSIDAQPLLVGVSIPPQAFFVRKIGGEDVKVVVMVSPGASAELYEPKPAQIVELSKAKLFFSLDAPWEKAWVDRLKSASPSMTIVNTAKDVVRPGGPDQPDPHIWLSPKLVKLQAKSVCDALCALEPSKAESYKTNLGSFERELDSLDVKLKDALAPMRGKAFLSYHPAWSYFARDYGLRMLCIEEEGKEVTAPHLESVIAEARKEGVKTVFCQPEFDSRSAESVARELGGTVVPISDLKPDWDKNLLEVAQAIAESGKGR